MVVTDNKTGFVELLPVDNDVQTRIITITFQNEETNIPKIFLSKEELIMARQMINEVKEKTKKEKVIVFQPFGRVSKKDNEDFVDVSGRSFEIENTMSLIRQLGKQYGIIFQTSI